jgi:hypothetical protein
VETAGQIKQMTPIVFIRQFHHQGGHFPGLPIAIRCARKWNPNGRVILIGDIHQKSELKALTEFHEMEKYSRLKDALNCVWPFHGSNDSWFYWSALSNFLVLANFVIQNDIPFVASFDPDVLLFDDIEKAVEPWRHVDVGACNAAGSMQCATLMSKEALREFAAFVIGLYTTGVSGQYSDAAKQESKCAMSAWRHFCAYNPRFKYGNLCDVTKGFTFDHSLGGDYGNYEFADGGRILHWRNGQPYGTRRRNGVTDYVRFVQLHCWSKHKQRMADYVLRSEESMR